MLSLIAPLTATWMCSCHHSVTSLDRQQETSVSTERLVMWHLILALRRVLCKGVAFQYPLGGFLSDFYSRKRSLISLYDLLRSDRLLQPVLR